MAMNNGSSSSTIALVYDDGGGRGVAAGAAPDPRRDLRAEDLHPELDALLLAAAADEELEHAPVAEPEVVVHGEAAPPGLQPLDQPPAGEVGLPEEWEHPVAGDLLRLPAPAAAAAPPQYQQQCGRCHPRRRSPPQRLPPQDPRRLHRRRTPVRSSEAQWDHWPSDLGKKKRGSKGERWQLALQLW
ncbi:hypothetical protein OsJ_14563 [Oryza sativa Japonica Group]|uniref:Uncharacterized protein n=1 Tax=Oryza sativa subsp. japonica TaxID=39947 RepID=A3AT75_ORYSJ|nr:hypothetical protein OsJ_14563 [Oryza sativa Japonica Group]